MSNNNLKICVLKIFMILICLGLFCSGSFDTSSSLYLSHDASAQDFSGLPMPLGGMVMLPEAYWSGFARYGPTQPYLGPIGSNYYNVPDILDVYSISERLIQ